MSTLADGSTTTAALLGIAGTGVGALLGLTAPLVSSFLERIQRRHQTQRELASKILALFEGSHASIDALRGEVSPLRRQLYIAALKMSDQEARQACLAVVADAGDPSVTPHQLAERWHTMIEHVGRVFRESK